MPRLTLRRDRILPGPLRSLLPESRGRAAPLRLALLPAVAVALAGAASLVALPRLAARPGADPAPLARSPDAPAVAPEVVATLPATLAAAQSVPVAASLAEAAAPPDASPFRLERLPVLQAGGMALDPVPAPARSARRTAASHREP